MCATCNIGFYTAGNTANTRATCSPCLAGSACSGTSSITLCPRGTAVNAGGTACVDCGSDSTYSASTGATTCATCVAGSFTAGGTPTQRHSCSPCTSGSKCSGTATVVSCGDDKSYSGPGASTCSICGGGSFTSGGAADGKTRSTCSSCLGGNSCDGSSSPVQCNAGYYSPPASPNCLPCGAGHKYSSAGASTCSTCPAGFRTEGGTSLTRTKCSVCPTGTRRRDEMYMYSPCSVLDSLLCPMSSQRKPLFPHACISSPLLISPSCLLALLIVPPGASCGSGDGSVSSCAPGKFASAGSSDCGDCGSDKLFADAGASICGTCPVGSFTSGGSSTTRTTCTACPAGSFCSDGSSTTAKCGKHQQSHKTPLPPPDSSDLLGTPSPWIPPRFSLTNWYIQHFAFIQVWGPSRQPGGARALIAATTTSMPRWKERVHAMSARLGRIRAVARRRRARNANHAPRASLVQGPPPSLRARGGRTVPRDLRPAACAAPTTCIRPPEVRAGYTYHGSLMYD